jgi:tetratricopeptide (TPR) repeat protein
MAKRVSIFAGLILWAGVSLWWAFILPGARAAAGDDAPSAIPTVQSLSPSAPGHANDQTPLAASPDRQGIIGVILARRELENVKFQVPVDLFRDYLAARGGAAPSNVPVAMIAEDSRYHVTVADGGVTVDAKLTIRVLDHIGAMNLPILCSGMSWDNISVDGHAVKLGAAADWLVWSPPREGVFTITAKAPLGGPKTSEALGLPVFPTVQTKVEFDSDHAYQVQVSGQAARNWLIVQGKIQRETAPPWTATLRGDQKGTHGEVPLWLSDCVQIKYGPVQPMEVHAARYELRGNVVCNLDSAAQQVTASLAVTIAGGPSDKITLIVPKDAQRVAVSGPEVKESRFDSGRMSVYLRSQVLGQTPLSLSYELPLAKGGSTALRHAQGPEQSRGASSPPSGEVRLGAVAVQDGYWQGGTLVVTNSAGGSEVLPVSATGLKEIGLYEAPASALASLPGPAAMAYSITSREFAASVEVVQLGEFTLRQSLADLAHYELFMQDDGAILCSVRYEVRNRSRQFLRVQLPKNSRLLLARVNEKSCPISQATDGLAAGSPSDGPWLLPLERSRASVIGLVSFPVEVVYACRIPAPSPGKGAAEIPLPAIDLPIAYAWSEVYLPEEMELTGLSGPMKEVAYFSNQTAKASLDYGWGELAEGYKESSRPVAPREEFGGLVTGKGYVHGEQRPAGKPGFFGFLDNMKTDAYRFSDPTPVTAYSASRAPLKPLPGLSAPAGGTESTHTWAASKGAKFTHDGEIDSAAILARNAYRAGKDYYEKGDYENAAKALQQAHKLAPGSVEAGNSERMIANINMLTGKMAVTDRAQKLEAIEVQKEARESHRPQEQQEEALVQGALEDARQGNVALAKQKIEAAGTISSTDRFTSLGGHPSKFISKEGKDITEVYDQIQKQSHEQAQQLKADVAKLKQSGDYDKALQAAGKAAQLEDSPELRKEMEQLAIDASKMAVLKDEKAKISLPTAVTQNLETTVSVPDGGTLLLGGSMRGDEVEQEAGVPVSKKIPATDRLFTSRGNARDEQTLQVTTKPKIIIQKEEEREAWDNAQVRRRQEEIRTSELARKKSAEADRRRRIADLTERAQALRSQQNFADALEVYNLIVKLDPTNAAAADMKAALEQFVLLKQERDSGATRATEEHKALKDIRESDIPYYESLLYPRDWREVTARREANGGAQNAGEPDADKAVRQKLGQKIAKLNFADTEFANVIEFLRDISGVNIIVKWQALGAVGIDKTAAVNVRLTDVRLDKALAAILENVSGATPLGYALSDGEVIISTKSDFGAVTLVYDIRDLIIDVPNLQGPRIDLNTAADQNATDTMRADRTQKVIETMKSVAPPASWGAGAGTISELSGQLVVTQTPQNQRAIERLLTGLRAARGPQVEFGKTIALQKNVQNLPAPAVTLFNGQRAVSPNNNGGPVSQGEEKRLQESFKRFIADNYDWMVRGDNRSAGTDSGWGFTRDREANYNDWDAWTGMTAGSVAAPDQAIRQLEVKLNYNLGQKVTVNSINANIDAQGAAQLGVKWTAGQNGVKWAIVDETQFRSLMELSSAKDRSGNAASSAGHMQETIVGTDARLSNGQYANVAFARESSNTLDIRGNAIDLPHENYLALDFSASPGGAQSARGAARAGNDARQFGKGSSITLVKAGTMQNWMEPPQEVQFVQVPQSIPVPRVGQLIQLEKSLLEPTDQMVLKVQYIFDLNRGGGTPRCED